jgi:hypothetical protein
VLGFFAPNLKNKRLSRGAILAIGIITILVALGFAAVGGMALSTPGGEFPPQFGYGMLGLCAICLLAAAGCFIPAARWWVIPVLAVVIVAGVTAANIVNLLNDLD